MRDIDFSKIRNIKDISTYFYCSIEDLESFVQTQDKTIFYLEIKIPKKNWRQAGNYRTVYAPQLSLKQIQKEIASILAQKVTFPTYVQGFIKGRSTVSNATFHLKKKVILNADIKDFFETITSTQVNKVFTDLGCNTHVADIFTQLTTINGILKQGLPTSPLLANIVATQLDKDFLGLAQKYSCDYTRYADDITLSSNDFLPSKEKVEGVLVRNGFTLNIKKFHIRKRGQSQYVTGLSVFDSLYPRVPKRFKRKFRLELYYILKYGLEEHMIRKELPLFAIPFQIKRLRGKLEYINGVEPILARKYRELLQSHELLEGISPKHIRILTKALSAHAEIEMIKKAEKILGRPLSELL